MAIAKSKINKIKYIEYKDFVEGIMPDGKSFYIDIEDFDIVKENYWHYCRGYLRSTRLGLMHRVLMKNNLVGEVEVDHINRNRLDNRKENLRIVTRQENMHNKSKYKTNTSGHRGIKWNKNLQKWQSQITVNKERIHLGVFDDLQDAIVARRKAENTLDK